MAIKIEGIIASGHLDKHNCIISEDALRDMVRIIGGPSKVRVGLEHDVLAPPIGWITDARIEPSGVTLAVVATKMLFDQRRSVVLPDGSEAFEYYADGEVFRFSCANDEPETDVSIHTDPICFRSFESHKAFEAQIDVPDEITCDLGTEMRRSVESDPVLIFSLASQLAATYVLMHGGKTFAQEVGKSLGEYSGQKLAATLRLLENTIRKFSSEMTGNGRTQTYVIRLVGNPFVELVARTEDADAVCKAYCDPQFGDVCKMVKDLDAAFGVDSVQFLLSDEGEWRFNYLLTKNGRVIGSKVAIDRRARILSELNVQLPV